MNALWIYKKTMVLGTPVLKGLLAARVRKGKEDPERLNERMGKTSLSRPSGPLAWIHVASVGEAQSILSLINLMLDQNQQLNILVTSVTKTSAGLLAQKLPQRAFHQYAPLDHPDWIRAFLDHWQPSLALWVESELWPNMLTYLKKRHIPAALLNAHMSPSSFRNWKKVSGLAKKLLSVFLVILAQSKQDAEFYSEFNPHSVVMTDNIKYSAEPLTYDTQDYTALKSAIGNRPTWLYASSHDGEEKLATEVHKKVAQIFPNILTIIAPRHPERRQEVVKTIEDAGLKVRLRGQDKAPPRPEDQIYIADTMGELGLFYKLSPLALIGRSFSDDGGGGHNPLEAALLDCAVLHGPHIQNSTQLYDEMDMAGAALKIERPDELAKTVTDLLSHQDRLENLLQKGASFARAKAGVLKIVLEELEPVFLEAHLLPPKVLA